MTVYEKSVSFSLLEEKVEDLCHILNNNIIEYREWYLIYLEYLKIKEMKGFNYSILSRYLAKNLFNASLRFNFRTSDLLNEITFDNLRKIIC